MLWGDILSLQNPTLRYMFGDDQQQGKVRTRERESGRAVIHKHQLETWLVGTYERPISAPTVGTLLGVGDESIPATRRRSARFVLAVLRDMFTNDHDVKHWLARSRPEFGNLSAAHVLLSGSLADVEEFVVREWNAFAGGA